MTGINKLLFCACISSNIPRGTNVISAMSFVISMAAEKADADYGCHVREFYQLQRAFNDKSNTPAVLAVRPPPASAQA
jgi:hypothetical protein